MSSMDDPVLCQKCHTKKREEVCKKAWRTKVRFRVIVAELESLRLPSDEEKEPVQG